MVVLGVVGLRGPRAPVFLGGIYFSCPSQGKPRVPSNTFYFFFLFFAPFSLPNPLWPPVRGRSVDRRQKGSRSSAGGNSGATV